MKKIILSVCLIGSLFVGATNVNAEETGADIAKKHNLKASTKAQRQWEKIFTKERRMKLLGINDLTKEQKDKLLKYLVKYAADSEQSTVPGM